MRNATAGILIAALSLLTLSACSSAPSDPAAGCSGGLPASAIASGVTVSGAIDTVPTTATFATPVVASTTSAAETTVGSGALVAPGDVVTANVTLFDGATGQAINGGPITLGTATGTDLPLLAGAVCAHVGSRVVVVGPASGQLGSYASQFGVDDTQTLVTTLDIDAAYLGRATGAKQLPVNGFPNVSLAPDGRPGVSFTGDPAPTDLRIETLIKGDGTVVVDGDDVVVQYTGIDWSTRSVFDSTWESNRPTIVATSGVVPGFKQALVGATVGSQVVAIVPPAEGYGDNPPSGSTLTKDSTMLFVIDILGIAPAGSVADSSAQ